VTTIANPAAKTASGNASVFVGLIILSALFFWTTISGAISYSLSHESSSHILLIPIVALVLIFRSRQQIFPAVNFALSAGIPIIAAGVALNLFARWMWPANEGNALLSASVLGLVLTWIGSFVLSFGINSSRQAAFPLLFLVLTVPFPDSLLDRIVYGLQVGSTELTYLFFKMARVPVLREGFVLAIPGATIEVAKECSGIRSSVALFITSLLAAHIFLRSRLNLAVFALLSLPVAILKNGIRIATLTLLSVYVDPGFLTGNLHRDGGFLFFILALVILAPILFFMEKKERRSQLQS
jgi:exosortase